MTEMYINKFNKGQNRINTVLVACDGANYDVLDCTKQ